MSQPIEPAAGSTPFDLCGPLPSGTTVLEASAGTGKTYTIAALATRFLADGVPLSDIMMVTFSRAATSELRLRVRDRLRETEAALRGTTLRGTARGDAAARGDDDDPVLTLLRTGDATEVTRRADRLAAALAEFDDATIATTHEFCSRMLDGLGVLGHAHPGRVFAESLHELVDQVAADTYLRLHADDDKPPFSVDAARQIAREVAHHPQCALVPDDPDLPRVRYARSVRAELRRRQQRMRLFTHDDVLFSLRDSLADPVTGDHAARILQQRYQVVLVDEFQDTDPVQWEIVQRAFHGHATLILIGDPKQAIYAFRGADVHAYLQAVDSAADRATLTTNWRSDGPITRAVDHLFAGAPLGDPRIRLGEVRAHHDQARIRTTTSESPAPIRLRIARSDPEADRLPGVGTLRPRIAQDLVAQIADLLGGRYELCDAAPDRPGWTPVRASDIAVLVHKNKTAEAIDAQLSSAGIPAVLSGGASVLGTEMAQHWLTLLRALVDPRSVTIRRAALTPMIGWDFARLATATESELADLATTIRSWSHLAAGKGIAALLEAILDGQDLPARLLTHDNGERQITDLRHIGQLLHAQFTGAYLGLPSLTEWLAEAIADARRAEDEQTRRLETDAEAVQVLTVHRAKGLEFGIVLLPEAWDRWVGSDDRDREAAMRFHELDPRTGQPGRLVLDVGGRAAEGRQARRTQWRTEEAGEDLRLLYVALTRARHQVITWWAGSNNTAASALHRLLYGPRRTGEPVPETVATTSDPDTLPLDSSLIAVEVMPDPAGAGVPGATTDRDAPESIAANRFTVDPGRLHRRDFTRTVDTTWRRTSYSALTARAHELSLASAHDEIGESDEPATAADLAPGVSGADTELPSPMGELPAGPEFGSIMHAIYEHADATAPDLEAELLTRTRAELARTPYPVQAEDLAAALVPAFLTPLGPLASQRRLCDIGPADRLSELDFELPLAGGDRPTTTVQLADVAHLLARHLGPEDPLHDYPALLAGDPTGSETLRGFLTGSIDSVLRLTDDTAHPKHLVVDYKSNWLGEFGAPLTLASYHPQQLAIAMMHAHYPLQALLYSVALHRFLRWRLPGYDPELHLGGIAYLFVRGMAGPQTPAVDGVPYGVFSWDPGAELILELSNLLDHGPGRRTA